MSNLKMILITCCDKSRIVEVEGEGPIPDSADEEVCPQCNRTARKAKAILEGHTPLSPGAGFYFNTTKAL